MKKLSLLTASVAVLTLVIALIGALFVGFNSDYDADDFGKGFKKALSNYTRGENDFPATSSLEEGGWLTVGGGWARPTAELPRATMAVYISGDIFPSALFHVLVALALCLLAELVFLAKRFYATGLKPGFWTVWRGDGVVHDHTTTSVK